MATKTKQWGSGTGSATVQYGGQGDGEIIVTTDPNNLYQSRSMQIVVGTTDGSGIQRTVTINQAAKQRIDISSAVVTASNQTYSGSAKTPTPTVTLNGSIVPSSGYDVSYSDNTNAGTATITVSGKGDYTGTASGTFTINKASRTISFTNNPRSVEDGDTISVSASASKGGSDGTISFSSSNSSIASVSGSTIYGNSEGTCTIYARISEGTNYLAASTSYSLKVINANFVDLGLPSRTIWAKKNIDVSTYDGFAASEYQYPCSFFSWGNIDGHNLNSNQSFDYDFGTSLTGPYASTTGATINSDIPLSQDAARQILGSPSKMPSSSDYNELLNYCSIDADTPSGHFKTINGVVGVKFVSNINGKSVFFPCSNFAYGCTWNGKESPGSLCIYWTKTYVSNTMANQMWANANSAPNLSNSGLGRNFGIPIRAIQVI